MRKIPRQKKKNMKKLHQNDSKNSLNIFNRKNRDRRASSALLIKKNSNSSFKNDKNIQKKTASLNKSFSSQIQTILKAQINTDLTKIFEQYENFINQIELRKSENNN